MAEAAAGEFSKELFSGQREKWGTQRKQAGDTDTNKECVSFLWA